VLSPALSATAWSAVDILLRQGVQFGITVVLARLLSPEAFGTIALLYLVAGLAAAFAEGGLSSALIQRQDTTGTDESTVFWLNIGVGVVVAALFFLAGPAIAGLYGVPVLEPLAGVMAMTVLAGAAGAVPRALFTKAMNFRPLVIVSLGSAVLSGGFAIWLAWNGWGVWALAGQAFVAAVATTTLTWLISPWRPALVFSTDSARRLFGFGGYLLASAILETTYTRLYTLLIGTFYGVVALGYYGRAETTAHMPASVINGIVARVAFPYFSRLATNDLGRLATSFRSALQGSMLIHAPAMLGLAAVAEPLVLVLFGEKWLYSVPFLRVLCLASLLMPLHVLNLQALMALGRADLFFRLEVIKKAIGIAILITASPLGPLGIAWGMVIAGAASYFVNAFYLSQLLGYGALHQLRDVVPIALTAFGMSMGVAWICLEAGDWPPSVLLAAASFCGAAAYTSFVVIFDVGGAARIAKFLWNKSTPPWRVT